MNKLMAAHRVEMLKMQSVILELPPFVGKSVNLYLGENAILVYFIA